MPVCWPAMTRARPPRRTERSPLGGDPADPTPLHFKLRTVLREAIESLAHAPGSRLPPAREMPAHTPVRYVERRIFGATGPVAFVRNFLPLPIGERLSRRDLRTTTLYELLTQRLGIKIAEVDDEVQAVLADTRVAPRLDVRVG